MMLGLGLGLSAGGATSPTFDPTTIFDWYADGDGYVVGTLTPLVGAAATEATNPPAVGAGGRQLNGHNTIDFDGTNDKLEVPTSSDYITTTEWFAFCLFNADAIDTANGGFYDNDTLWVVANSAAAAFTLHSGVPNLQVAVYSGGAKKDEQAIATGTWVLGLGKLQDGALYSRLGAGAWSAGTACGATASLAQPIRMGVDYDTGAHRFDGRIAALGFAKVVPSEANITALLSYIQTRYGVTP